MRATDTDNFGSVKTTGFYLAPRIRGRKEYETEPLLSEVCLFSIVFPEVCVSAADAQSTSEWSESRSFLLFPQGQFVLQTAE